MPRTTYVYVVKKLHNMCKEINLENIVLLARNISMASVDQTSFS